MNTTQLAQSRLARSGIIPVTFRVGERFYDMLGTRNRQGTWTWCCYCCSCYCCSSLMMLLPWQHDVVIVVVVFQVYICFWIRVKTTQEALLRYHFEKAGFQTGSWIWLVTGDEGDKSVELLEQRSQIKIQKKNRCIHVSKKHLITGGVLFKWVDFRLEHVTLHQLFEKTQCFKQARLWTVLFATATEPESSNISPSIKYRVRRGVDIPSGLWVSPVRFSRTVAKPLHRWDEKIVESWWHDDMPEKPDGTCHL